MSATFNLFRSRSTARVAAALAAAGSLLALAATTNAADPWHWRSEHRRPGVVIVARPSPVVISYPAPPVVVTYRPEVVPSDLRFSAYQSRDTVIVLITGCNAGAGFTTALTGVEQREGSTTILMCNTPSGDAISGGPAQFSLNASVRSYYPLSTIMVRVAGQTFSVPVTQVQALS